MIMRARTCLGWAIVAASLAAAAPAFAAEKKPASKKLPGVEGDYQIVKPYVPEPEPDQAPSAKTGGWDVKVSGQLTIDVGTGGLPLPRN
jgi:hypothetical protein